MSAIIMTAIISVIVSLFIGTLTLWLLGQTNLFTPIGVRRAVLAWLIPWLIILGGNGLTLLVLPADYAALALVISLILAVLAMALVLKAAVWRAICAFLIVAVLQGLINTAAGRLIKSTVFDTYASHGAAMMPTLLGTHREFVCPNCDQPCLLADPPYLHDEEVVRCPYCYQEVTVNDEWIAEPDRILGMRGETIQRWDLISFPDPADDKTVFCMRAIGMPGEVVQLIEGDVYTVDLEDVIANDPDFPEREKEWRRQLHDYEQSPDEARRQQLLDTALERANDLRPLLSIQRKPAAIQNDLWIPMHHHESHLLGGALTPYSWVPLDASPGNAWDTTTTEMAFAPQDEEFHSIRLNETIRQISPYDVMAQMHGPRNPAIVRDLRLRCEWTPDVDEGHFELCVDRREGAICGVIDTEHGGRIESRRVDTAAEVLISNAECRLKPQTANRLTFGVADEQASFSVNGKTLDILLDAEPHASSRSSDEESNPDARISVEDLSPETPRPQVTIGASGSSGTLTSVWVDRDVHYGNVIQNEPGRRPQLTPNSPSIANPYRGFPGWGTDSMPIVLCSTEFPECGSGRDEYFVLGDHSSLSKDSRLWWQRGPTATELGPAYQPGTLTADQIETIIHYIYWPQHRWRSFPAARR